MTISIQANAAGTAGQINIGATPVVNLPVASGLPFCKNKLFNGEVTRINQRGFDGNWATKPLWFAGTQAERESAYGYDMWANTNFPAAGYMVQFIEAGNYRPSTVHTISGTGMTTRQETSPASGNWAVQVPQTARNIQVEEGSVATPFEIRPISFELSQCQRYYQASYNGVPAGTATEVGAIQCEANTNPFWIAAMTTQFKVTMRTVPAVTIYAGNVSGLGIADRFSAVDVGSVYISNFAAQTFGVSPNSFGAAPQISSPANTFAVAYHFRATAVI